MNAANRVILNTGILYAKMLITMFITLYSARLILDSLGALDYGIYNLIAGVIVMLSFLNAAMAASTQRYLSFHQGTGNCEMQKKIFTNSWVLHIIIAIIVVILLIVVMPFLFGGFLNIPLSKLSAAKAIYSLMSVSVFFTIISVPFTALLNAHENMVWIAIVSILESVLKLGVVLSLSWFAQIDRLVVYGILIAVLSLIIFSLYAVYCLRKYKECSVRNYHIDKSLIKELGNFAGWNLYGTFTSLGKGQGMGILLNIFYGVTVNAAYGIANTVSSQINLFSANISMAMRPQVIKSVGMENKDRMLKLALTNIKITFLIFSIFCIPLMTEMPYVLTIWLKNVPEYTVIFCRFTLLIALLTQLSNGLFMIVESVGIIKWNQIFIGTLHIFVLPIAFLCLKAGYPVHSVFICILIEEIVAWALRLFFAGKISGLSIKKYLSTTLVPNIGIVVIAFIASLLVSNLFNEDGIFNFITITSVNLIVILLGGYKFSLNTEEKEVVLRKLILIKTGVRNKYYGEYFKKIE